MAGQGGQVLELTLRGFSPQELARCAEERCVARFGRGGFSVEEVRCVPCVCSVGGRVRLYETHVRARPLVAHGAVG